MSDLLDAALAYVRRGWHVFPCKPAITGDKTSGKDPLTANGFKDATTDESVIRAWWTQHPNANIGIACDASGLVCLDVDSKDGSKGFESLAEFESLLPDTLKAKTGSGALHAIYLRGDHPARQTLGVRDGIDIIGKGYFIAAPSVHYSGNRYEWLNTITPVVQPPILISIQRIGKALADPITRGERAVMADTPSKIVAAAAIADQFPAKGRHFAFLALSGALAKEGWDIDGITEFTQMVARLLPYASEYDRAKAWNDRPLQARDSVARLDRGDDVLGWGELAKHVPQSAIDTCTERLGFRAHELDWVRGIQAPVSPIDLGALGTLDPNEESSGVTWIGDLAGRKYPPVVSYPTPYPTLNALLGGGISTQLLQILLGKPGAGKTAFFVSVALHLQSTVPVLYVSTELQHNEIVARLASPLVKVPWRDIVRGLACNPDGSRITEEQLGSLLARYRIAIIAQDEVYQAGEKALELIAKTAIKVKDQCGIAPVIMVDYLQELARGDGDKARTMNTKVAVTMRMLSQRLDCAWFAVSSVSRAGYGAKANELRQADNPEVYLALAKESGDIDYAAATIVFLDVSEERDGNGWKMARAAASKSRHGETGFCGLRFHGATGDWEEHAEGIQALSEESRNGFRAEKQILDLKARVVLKVREQCMLGVDPGTGLSHYVGKTELRALLGGNSTQVGVAIDQAIREGLIVEIGENGQNPVTKRLIQRKVISLPPAGYEPPKQEAPVDVTAALLGIVGVPKT